MATLAPFEHNSSGQKCIERINRQFYPAGTSPPAHFSRRGTLWTPLAKEFGLAGSKRKTFSAVVPEPWNIVPAEVRSVPTFLAFKKGSANWPDVPTGASHFGGA